MQTLEYYPKQDNSAKYSQNYSEQDSDSKNDKNSVKDNEEGTLQKNEETYGSFSLDIEIDADGKTPFLT